MDVDPLVTPFDPRWGWAAADRPRRAFAVLALVVVPALVALTWTGHPGWTALLALTLGPPSCSSLARVLRPHRAPSAERTWRHGLAGTATSAAVPVLTVMALDAVSSLGSNDGVGVVVLLGVPAAFLGFVTVIWGSVAFAGRLVTRHTGRRPLAELVDPSEPGVG